MMTKQWFDDVAASSLGYREALEQTYTIARSLIDQEIPGDFVECGVYAGAHCAVMANAFLSSHREDDRRKIHLFDSFEGLPAADERDQEIWAHHGAKTGEAACSLSDVKANMKRWGIPDSMLVYHPGWFEVTVPAWRTGFPNRIALLRLDADLYSSTKTCLEYLYPLVVRGGWVIVDDWNLSGCRQAVNEIVVPAPICWRTPTK
jgi:O-methyltransferase